MWIRMVSDGWFASSDGTNWTFHSNLNDACAAYGEHQVKACEYCGKNVNVAVYSEYVNGKFACQECRLKLVPPMAGYMDKTGKMLG
jgi:hypothetical protein